MGKRTQKERERDFLADQAPYIGRYRKIWRDPEFHEDLKVYDWLVERENASGTDHVRLYEELLTYRVFDEPGAVLTNPKLKPLWDEWRQSRMVHAIAKQEREAMEEEIIRRYGILLLGLRPRGIFAGLSLTHYNALVANMPWVFNDQLPVQPIRLKPSKEGGGDITSTTLLGGKYLPLLVNMEHTLDAIRNNFDEWIKFVGEALRNQRKHGGEKARRHRPDTDARRAEVRRLAAQGKAKEEIAAEIFPDGWKDSANHKRLTVRVSYYLAPSER